MRRRLIVLVAATTSVVLMAFLVPLAMLVQSFAEDRALGTATIRAQSIAPMVATGDEQMVSTGIDRANTGSRFPITLFRADGSTVGAPAERSSAVELAFTGRSLTADAAEGGREVLVFVSTPQRDPSVIRAHVPTEELWAGVVRAWLFLAGLGVTLFVLSLVLADRLGRALVGSVSDLARVSESLAAGDLEARADPSGPPEVAAVAGTLNVLARRISELLVAERERVADLSHRVRTPLTALRLDAESVRDPAERERIESGVAAVERAVTHTINEARRPDPVSSGCDATKVIGDRVSFWSVLAEDQDRHVSVTLARQPLPVRLSESDLASAVDALLGNVFAHTDEGTAFALGLWPGPDGAGAILVVEDEGPGIPADATERGSSGAGSSGLGLDIARRAAELSGGGFDVGTGLRGGARITLTFGGVSG
ncbi:sensor histidine kinase [Allonocardiopsis opalescens]|uniref:Signal transduction histidine-protein kinase/phosphatase MprB n=1 Tax=Allonocardiopsis opalescens TaxID=1144618 RepID=A0A2T0PXX4_9ACTN|nr:HAMP domain-containing sensor histidine kinase [Allonocardiopsis opalescens]PRX96377.1 signal transduction histidine kinase [Allonocardiopsis opalescens]